MSASALNVAVMGSTGSIGRSTLDVILGSPERLNVVALSAYQQLDMLVAQAQKFRPRWVVAADETAASRHSWSGLPKESELLLGPDALDLVASREEVDVVVAAIVGSAGLRSTWSALQAGKRVALANKETMVIAGPLVRAVLDQTSATLMPVDSEHSAIFQAMAAGRREDVRRVILTASGGPFRMFNAQQLQQVTVAQALDHPTWEMGKKITIDSATMMNKALEVIEARWLFDLSPAQIDVVIHPQSCVHSMVEFVDGSVISQSSPPDMRLPIQYALSYPERWPSPAERSDFQHPQCWEFHPPNHDLFPAIRLGMDVAESGGTSGAVLNAANEVAVESFLDGQIAFTEIVPMCRSILEQHNFNPRPTLDELLQCDVWARKEVSRWISA